MAGNPFHNATRCSGCALQHYKTRPNAHPSKRVEAFHGVYRHLATFARPSLFVFHGSPSVWQPFKSDALAAAVVSDDCAWRSDEARRENASRPLDGQYVNIYCSLLLMLAHEAAHGMRHQYVARMRPDFPVEFSPGWLSAAEGRLVVAAMNPLQAPYADWRDAQCSNPGEAVFPPDQFFVGQHAVMGQVLRSMVRVSRWEERHLMVYLAVHHASWTYVRTAPAVRGPDSLGDGDMLVNASGVYCRRYYGEGASYAWQRRCGFPRWDPHRMAQGHVARSTATLKCVEV